MAALLTTAELATWTQNDPDVVAADPFALEVIDKVSQLAQFVGGHPEWSLAEDETKAPFDVRMVVLMVCKRTYSNPDQEISTQVGPIGSRVLDVAALLTELTETERATLAKYNAEGDPAGGDGLWVLKGTEGPPVLQEAVMYVPDDSLSDWYIPMFHPDDPGDPSAYPEG